MTKNIWSIGGTSESAAIAEAIASIVTDNVRLPLIITVVSPTARSLYPSNFKVVSGRMDGAAMTDFCRREGVIAVVDASHPYAVEVSRQAIATAKNLNLPYLRYERKAIATTDDNNSLITRLNSFESLLAGRYLNNQRVLLTIGCKALPLFKNWHDRATLFARILPKPESLDIALKSSFTSDRLICLRPPLGLELETALWRQWNISLVVTKASGTAGGEDIKSQAAAELKIPLIVIDRPKVNYPQQTNSINEVVAFCRRYLSKNIERL
ncbi:cobalt-precorrin-6A reductase [Myxosarcina sp. GI1]|uniref:cobalt-precorrin-6A reductase n=1 Tax=Myxosarcina sp. GI1 TaxID=1541065 RepID=UPI0005620F45|nr:cobalt-precorrin-6A reductase [Myxosarcina sp. GI1]